MGRRRWRFVAIAAFLLTVTDDSQCQDENDFYYAPVERNFAQVQPPIYTNSRPTSYFEQDDRYRVAQPTIASSVQQPLYNDGHVRFPSPNYNQNPSPFQLPSGRSQSGNQYYINQPDFGATPRQRFRLALPHNDQFVHPASTKKPEQAPIHSVAYQNDPSKPEAFLGQVTINNPDIEYLHNNRFKNIQFDGNSLKSSIHNHQEGPPDDDVEIDNQDLYEHHRVTTYNPSKLKKQRPSIPNPGRFPHYGSESEEEKEPIQKPANKIFINNRNNFKDAKQPPIATNLKDSSTEYKTILDLEPLLEDDISDSSFRELMKNTKGSNDVQVINSNHTEDTEKYDSNPSATSMTQDKLQKTDTPRNEVTERHMLSSSEQPSVIPDISANENDKSENEHSDQESHGGGTENEDNEDDAEYVEYYDDVETTETPPRSPLKLESGENISEYDEYDSTEEIDHATEPKEHLPNNKTTKSSDSFDVLVMKTNKPMVKDDNFKTFIDTTVIDQVENVTDEFVTDSEASKEELTSIETPSILGQEVVSVVTTKSVVNGTISVPDTTYPPSTAKINFSLETNETLPVTTENWVVVASVQTSRSVSGARFLPFPTVEQEEKKQVLTDEKDESSDDVTENPKYGHNASEHQQTTSQSSTENINDKLDSIQSELSSDVLSGSLDSEKNIEIITESSAVNQTTTEPPTTTSLNIFTLRSTEVAPTTEKSSPDPLPVHIKKFTPRITTSTTVKPRKKLVTVMDDLSASLLPPGYKPRLTFKDKRTSTTTSTTTSIPRTTTTTAAPYLSSEEDYINGTQGRSSGISSKNKVILRDNKSPTTLKDFKPKEVKSKEDILSKFPQSDLSKLVPPGFKSIESGSTESKESKIPNVFKNIQQVDISAFLPKGFNLTTTTSEKPKIISEVLEKATPVDISAFLPPGFKLNTTQKENSEGDVKNIKIADISNLLPPGYNLNESDESTSSTTKVPSSGGIKLVFPSRPGNKPTRKPGTPKPVTGQGPVPVTPKIQKGWPIRSATEFTGWPSPSTTPFSIEKLLEAQRNATATSPMPDAKTEAATRRPRPSSTTTTTEPPEPTTPGVCKRECDLAATIKIVSGVKWVPELLDHNTEEWQLLADDVKSELNSVYSKSDMLKKWFKSVRIEGFSKGSVLVDYYIELNNINDKVNTVELKKMFHRSLEGAKAGAYVESIEDTKEEFDPDMMLGDQPDEERINKSDERMKKTIDKSAGKLELGKFVMDPAFTEFIVLPKREEPKPAQPEEESFLPQWGIAVIVIALASLLFVVIFGVTVLVNRQKSAKAKQPIPLSEDMLRELDKSHMGGFDDLPPAKERDPPYHSGKRMSTAFIEQLAYPNPGDSWRSEWTPQLQQYMQHYTPDSGRGSQTYGAGNPYGYSGSQLYGQTGSQLYGYTGEYPPRQYSRRRSEYDPSF